MEDLKEPLQRAAHNVLIGVINGDVLITHERLMAIQFALAYTERGEGGGMQALISSLGRMVEVLERRVKRLEEKDNPVSEELPFA